MKLKAILFDVDGTLYSQREMRWLMLRALIKFFVGSPIKGGKIIWVLYHFRKLRERARDTIDLKDCLDSLQYELTSRKTELSEQLVKQIVGEWIYDRPLKYIQRCRYEGVETLLKRCRDNGLKAGVLSDYPPYDKVEALGLTAFLNLYLSSTDPEINAFKPDPAGITHACTVWNISPRELLYVGDRTDTDGKAAGRAGSCFFHLENNFGKLEQWISERI